MSNFTFFWGSYSPFSNWHQPNVFIHNGVEYNCSEQFMMHQKALLFNDLEVADLIMELDNPRKQKAAGRMVRNFDAAVWSARCEDIMFDGLLSKFTQDSALKEELLNTAGTELVEASPYDTIWGIGLDEKHPDAQDKTKWKGKNLLGIVLDRVRDHIIKNNL